MNLKKLTILISKLGQRMNIQSQCEQSVGEQNVRDTFVGPDIMVSLDDFSKELSSVCRQARHREGNADPYRGVTSMEK